MIDLKTKALPDTVLVDGEAFTLNTDYRLWLRFIQEYNQAVRKRETQLADVSYLFAEEVPEYCDISILLNFANPPKQLPRPIGERHDVIAYDYDIDADLIFAGFMEQYKINLLETDMHWYVFKALFEGLSPETEIGRVMGYRCYKKSEGRRDIYADLQKAWRIEYPEELTEEEKKANAEFDSYFIKE